MAAPRIAVLGMFCECNVLVPMYTPEEFDWLGMFRGEEITQALRDKDAFVAPEVRSFCKSMDETGDWEIAPILLGFAESGPPFPESLFRDLVAEMAERLKAAGPIDGVFVSTHGSIRTDETLDAEGVIYAMIRDVLGYDVPVIAILDLHGKLSGQMMYMTDLLVGYRTNPHVDMIARGREAALSMRRMLKGDRMTRAFVRVPLVAPPTALGTLRGPFADIVNYANEALPEEDGNITVLGGFPYLDTPFNGINISIATWRDSNRAAELAADLGNQCWAMRHLPLPEYMSLEDAVEMAVKVGENPDAPPILFADVADNPGGGSRGNTIYILRALYEAGAQGVHLGPFWDPAVAAEAHKVGLGGKFRAKFNTIQPTQFAEPFEADAEVVGLSDGKVRMIGGPADGMMVKHGLMAAVKVGGVSVLATTGRFQALSGEQFRTAGLEPREARTIVVKSRGHFRADFENYVPSERVYELSLRGQTMADIKQIPYKNLQRPVHPFDPHMEWEAAPDVRVYRPLKKIKGESLSERKRYQ